MVSEVILESNGKIKVARVLVKWNTPIKKYPEFGTWCYLLDAGDQIVVFDTGPKYIAFRPIFRKFSRKLNNAELIIEALEKYFPNKTIREIIFSHFHYDHSEAGPDLQQKIKKKFGNIPPIRLHKKDYEIKKVMKIYNHSLDKIYKNAGYKTWKIGSFVKNGENIKGTNFNVIHLPGHTEGTIGLISKKDKVFICGWWVKKIENKSVNFAVNIINENNKKLKETIKKVSLEGYNFYYYHPEIIKRKKVLLFVKKILQKKISVFCSSSENIDSEYLKVGKELGKELAFRNAKILFGGTNSGLMKELAESVIENKGNLVSVYVKKEKNIFTKCNTVKVRTPEARKNYLIKKSDLIICLLGGFGTLEELHDSIVLNQINNVKKPILIVNTNGFFNPIIEMHNKIFEEKFAKKEKLYDVFDNVEDLITYMEINS